MSGANQYAYADGTPRPVAERPRGANQFTKGTRAKMDQRTRDAIRAEMIAKRLYAFSMGRLTKPGEEPGSTVPDELSQAQVAAAKVLVSVGKATLASVEQTTVEPEIDASSVIERLQAMLASPHILRALAADPATRAQLLAALNAAPIAVHTPVDTPDLPSAAAA